LNGIESVTHHEVIEHLEEIAPLTIINYNARFIDNGKIMTSGGFQQE
jgi:transcriptional regulator GlxA family with amidase domain